MKHDYEIKNGFVQIPEGDFIALQNQLEDLHDEAALKKALDNMEEFFPGEVLKALLDGENPIRVFRKHRTLTQKELAEKIGVTQTTIADIESGKNKGSIETFKKLAEALDVDIDDLV